MKNSKILTQMFLFWKWQTKIILHLNEEEELLLRKVKKFQVKHHLLTADAFTAVMKDILPQKIKIKTTKLVNMLEFLDMKPGMDGLE